MAEHATPGQIVDTTSFVATFPQVEGVEISRDNILQTLETMIDGRDIKSVHIEGASGAGKSVLLAQFAKSYRNRTISVFAKRSSWFTYDPSFLVHDLAAQMYWLVERKEPNFPGEITDVMFRSLVYKLRTYSTRLGKPLVLVLDGLAEIPEEQNDLKRLLISKLPLGLDYIKLLTSASARECNLISGAKDWLVPPFSTEESLAYFGTALSTERVRVVHATCGGAPGFLSGIRRLLVSGISEEELLSELPTTLPEIFALEWRSVDEADTLLLEALALLAHDSNKHNLIGLASTVGASVQTLRVSLSRLRFINLPDVDEKDVEFVSDPFRQFVSDKLAHLREVVTQKIIDRLSSNEDSDESVTFLPSYLRQAGENRRLLSYLSPDRFARLLDSQHQMSPVRQKVLLGLETAQELNNHSEILRFAVQASALSEYSGFTVSHSEISARMELQDDTSCIALAQAAVLTNDRLRLLAVVARKKREKGDTLEPELIGELETLFKRAEWKEIDHDSLSELATDLLYVRPELATQALENGTMGKSSPSRRLDVALASASMTAAASQDTSVRDNAQRLGASIKDPRFLSMFNALGAVFRGVDSNDVIAKVKELSTVKAQIYLLRQWSLHSRIKNGASVVTSYALDVAIRATEYTPTATDFRELAETLRRIDNPKELIELIRRFDAQRALIEATGPTADFHYLQLLLALGEARVDKNAAANRLVEVYSSVVQIRDLAVRTACLARILNLLPLIDPDGSIRQKEGLEELVCQAFDTALESLLAATADHTYATRDIIAALAPRYPKMALRVALALNTASRRDSALQWLITSMLRMEENSLDLSELKSIVDKIYDRDYAEDSVCQVLERLADIDVSSSVIKGIETALVFSAGSALNFNHANLQLRSCCAALLCVSRFNVQLNEDLKELLIAKMDQSWDRLDLDGEKIAIGFKVAGRFAALDRGIAEEWLKKAESCRVSHNISASSESYCRFLLLVSRSYMGLIKKRLDQPEDLAVLGRLIERIPSSLERLALWTDVALRALTCGRVIEAQEIGRTNLLRLLAHYPGGTCERYNAITVAIPALFHTSKVTAMELIKELPPMWLDSAVLQVVSFILKKQPTWDPYETRHHQAYVLTIDEMFDLCDLAAKTTTDSSIHWIVSMISISLRTKEARKTITGTQKSDVIAKLKSLRDTRFPASNGISHNGYKILCSGEIAELERYQKATWETILADARAIPNLADRCLVLSDLAGRIAKHDDEWAFQILKECELYAHEIPSALDRASRLHTMAREAYDVNKELAKDFYTQALLMTATGGDPEYESVRRDIIDSAHKISPELASGIASALDDDQARRAKRGVSSRIEILELQRRLMDQRIDENQLPVGAKDRLAEASWSLLGSLNSGKIVTVKISQTKAYLEHAANIPFSSAFPIYAYVIENAIERPQDKVEGERSLRSLHRSLTVSADLFYYLAERGVAGIPAQQRVDVIDGEDYCFVDADQRQKGLEFIEKWLVNKTGMNVTIHDPFLTPSDVAEILKMILLVKPDLQVNLITSKIGLLRARVTAPFAGQFRTAWAKSSSQSAPVTRIIVVSVGSEGNPLIHDRWWSSDGSALELGTSFNGLGYEKSSKINAVYKNEAEQIASRLANITNMGIRHIEEKRVVYESVDL